VGRRAVQATGQALEHVAQVADEAARDGLDLDPAGGRPHLEPARVVLAEHREQAVVGVFGHPPPLVVSRVGGRVVEDAEQAHRVGREVPGEPRAVETEPECDAAQHRLAEPGHLCHVREHRLPQLGRTAGKEVGAMQGRASEDARMVRTELGAEVQPLLEIGDTRGELAADREPTPPRTTGPRHRDLGLLTVRQREEPASGCVELALEVGVHAMAHDGEEPHLPTGGVDRRRAVGGIGRVAVASHERAHVDHGNLDHRSPSVGLRLTR
jgi:hypothetical protein